MTKAALYPVETDNDRLQFETLISQLRKAEARLASGAELAGRRSSSSRRQRS
jgi:hypothetical protein